MNGKQTASRSAGYRLRRALVALRVLLCLTVALTNFSQSNAASTMPGTGIVSGDNYGALAVLGATLSGNTITNIQPGALIQLGGIPGTPGSYLEFDFFGFDISAGNTLTVRSGAAGQTVVIKNYDVNPAQIAGMLHIQGANGAPPPFLYFQGQNGVTVAATGGILAPSGAQVRALFSSWTDGEPLMNHGLIDGGPQLQVQGLKIGGGGAYKGNTIALSTPTFANNPVNGAHFLANGLQLYPSTGTDVFVTLHAYGSAPQVLNVFVNGNATAWMPSNWGPSGGGIPLNNAVVPPDGTRLPGTPEPTYGGGSIIVQATGNLTLANGGTNDFVFPGAIALKAGGTLDLNGVVVNQGWTITGKQFQGAFFESPNITSSMGNIQVLTNNPNWINFSTLPQQHVRTWSLTQNGSGGASYVVADSFATHLNTYSVSVEAAANGQCWVCLINTSPVNMY